MRSDCQSPPLTRVLIMLIRKAASQDIARLVRMYRQFDENANNAVAHHRMQDTLAQINRSGFVAIAEEENQIMGTYTFYLCPNLARDCRPFAVIENVIVDASRRRREIGKTLMNHAIETAKELGCYKLMLCTSADWNDNVQFYLSCGFINNKTGFEYRFVP